MEKESAAAIKRSSDGPPTWAAATSSSTAWMHTSGDQLIGWCVQVHPCITPPEGCQLWHIVARDHCICSPNCSQASEIKSPWEPICYSRRTQLQQCVTHYTLTLSWLAFFSSNQRFDLWRIFPIVPFLYFFFFVHFFPSVMIALFLFCFTVSFSWFLWWLQASHE